MKTQQKKEKLKKCQKKKYEESLNFQLKKEDFENLEKKYNSDISGSSFDNYYS